jgi:hypothetical protein
VQDIQFTIEICSVSSGLTQHLWAQEQALENRPSGAAGERGEPTDHAHYARSPAEWTGRGGSGGFSGADPEGANHVVLVRACENSMILVPTVLYENQHNFSLFLSHTRPQTLYHQIQYVLVLVPPFRSSSNFGPPPCLRQINGRVIALFLLL